MMESSKQSTANEIDILDWEGSRPQHFSFLKHMFAGSLAGVMEHGGMFPFDTIKTHMQASKQKIGVVDTMKQLYRREGFSRFWRGINVIASGGIPAHACYFATYEVAKETFGIDDGHSHFLVSGLVGALATLSHDAFITPSDVVKQRMQINDLSATQGISKMLREEGARAFFRSYPVTTMMNIPFAFVIVSTNENLKVFVQPKKRKRPLASYFGGAFIAGVTASVLTNPLDVIKTRLQVQHEASNQFENVENTRKPEKLSYNTKYKNVAHATRKILRKEGVHGFFRGTLPRIMVEGPGAAISWGTYEFFKSVLISEEHI